jgi:hypothetical protein
VGPLALAAGGADRARHDVEEQVLVERRRIDELATLRRHSR